MQAIGRLFKPREATLSGRRLYAAAAAHARQPALYTAAGVPDTYEGRFELLTLHVLLILHRLKGEGPRAAETGQALFDAYLKGLDDALREMGVGDLSVGKKMRKLGAAFYGRAKNYDDAFAALPDLGPLEALIARTAYAEAPGGDPAALAAYAVACVEALRGEPLELLFEGELAWPAFGGVA